MYGTLFIMLTVSPSGQILSKDGSFFDPKTSAFVTICWLVHHANIANTDQQWIVFLRTHKHSWNFEYKWVNNIKI